MEKRKKLIAAAAAAVLAATLIVTGTFAWQSFSANAANNAKGAPGPAGGRLHDDFEVIGEDFGLAEWGAGVTANKDIYVENYESTDNDGRDIFVRIKLYEYMEIGLGATEDPFLADGTTPNPAYSTREATPLIAGAVRDDYATWTPRLPATDIDSDMFKARWGWAYGGQKTYMPTFNKDSHSEETDIKGDAVDPNPLGGTEPDNTTEIDGTYAYAADAGKQDYFASTATTWDAQEKFWDETLVGTGTVAVPAGDHALTPDPVTHTAKPTLSAQVITMAEWKLAPYSGQPGNFWILDSDGWVYWANPIAPQSATGLLIDSITLQGEPDAEWYYSIYVRSEMATAADWMSSAEGMGFYADVAEAPSEDAEGLLNIITGHLPKVTGVYLDHNTAAVNVNGTLTLTASVVTENTNDPAYEEVTWSITPAAGSRFANGTFSPSTVDADKWFTVRATAVMNTNIYAECKVYVPNTSQGVLTGSDGNVYLYFVDNDDNTYQRVNSDGTLGALVCPVELGKPGAPTDRTNVATINGVHYLDEGNDRYYAKGADGKLGTADDELMYDSGGGVLLPVENTVNLSVTPSPATVIKGQTLTLTASATLNSVPQDVTGVTWQLVGTYSTNTSISGTGETAMLTADAAETAETITVRATYPGSTGTSKDITVAIANPTLQVATTRYISAAKAGDTSDWIEIATYGSYSLIIRKDDLPTRVTTAARNYIGSPQQTAVNNWFSGTTTLTNDAPLRSIAMQNDVLSNLGTWGNTTSGLSRPIVGTTGASGNNIAFLASHSEYAAFCSLQTQYTNASQAASSAAARTNFAALTWRGSSLNPGRSPCTYAANYTCGVLFSSPYAFASLSGLAGGTYSGDSTYYYNRPMLWVDSQAGASMFESR